MKQEDIDRIAKFREESASELLHNVHFIEMLKVLALKIKDIDTVKNINKDLSIEEIGQLTLSNSLAIEIIENWLGDILGLANMSSYAEAANEEIDDTISVIIDESKRRQ